MHRIVFESARVKLRHRRRTNPRLVVPPEQMAARTAALHLFSETISQLRSIVAHTVRARPLCTCRSGDACCRAICPSVTVHHTNSFQAYSGSTTHASRRGTSSHALNSINTPVDYRDPPDSPSALLLYLSTQSGSSECLKSLFGRRFGRSLSARQSTLIKLYHQGAPFGNSGPCFYNCRNLAVTTEGPWKDPLDRIISRSKIELCIS